MMKLAFACAASAAVLLTATSASAQSPEVAWNVGVVTDYVFRGVSQTDETTALQGGLDVTSGGFYFGVWGSNVDFAGDEDIEVDMYLGYRTEVGGAALDVGVVGYAYPGAEGEANYDYFELKAAASRAIGPITLGAQAYWSPDFFGIDEDATYAEVNAAFAIAPQWTISGAAGHQLLDVSEDYTAWNAGVSYALNSTVGVDLRYHGTDIEDAPMADDRIVAGLKFTF